MISPRLTLHVLLAAALLSLSVAAQPVGAGNGRDLVLTSSLDGGAMTDASKLTTWNQLLHVRVDSPQASLGGAPMLLAYELRHRTDDQVIALPGEPDVVGLSTGLSFVVAGAPLPVSGFSYSVVVPDLTPLGDVSLWVQAAAFDSGAPNGHAITRAVRHDRLLLESRVSHDATEYNSGTRFGYAAVCVDVDGTGADELIVGLPGADPSYTSEAGQVRILEAMTNVVLTTLTAPSPQAGAWFGSSVAAADVTGDGVVDVIVGAREEDEAGVINAGAVYVFEGPSFTNVTRLVSPSPEAVARFGHAVAAADWNDDGIADVVVGAPRETSGGEPEAGRVHVFPGPAFGTVVTIESPSPQALAKFGYGVASGQLDGVGGDDLAVTAPFHDVSSGDDTGRAYVFASLSATPLATIEQPQDDFALLGSSLCIADFDADGNLDVAVGAEFDDDAVLDGGSVHIAYGPSFVTTYEFSSPSPLVSAGFGSAVSAGDVNADGYTDLVVGEFWRDVAGQTQAGSAWAMLGPMFVQGRELLPPVVRPSDKFGRRVACGDLDGDRFDDPVICAPFASPPGANTEGEIHVFSQ